MEEQKVIRKKSRWSRVVLWVLLSPIALLLMLMALLYVPPVQHFICEKATRMVSEATGMDITIGRIGLHFPLNLEVRRVCVVQQPDTLLNLERITLKVQFLPLLGGQVELDELLLEEASVNSSALIEGMQLKGNLGRFFLESHGISLPDSEVILNQIELDNTHLQVQMTDTTSVPEDTTETAILPWKIHLHTLALNNVSVQLDMPVDSMMLNARIHEAQVQEARADLQAGYYALNRLMLNRSDLSYDVGTSQPASGFDPSHIRLRDIEIGIDSVSVAGRDMEAQIRTFSMNERCGLAIQAIQGSLHTDSSLVEVPKLQLLTPHSEITLRAHTYWKLIDMPTTGHLSAALHARIGKQDVMLLTGTLPETFKEAYPEHSLVIHAGTEGNMREMQLSRFSADLPGAFELQGGGVIHHLTDSVKRSGSFDFEMQTHDLNFLTGLTALTPDSSIVVPDSMYFKANLNMKGPEYQATMHVCEDKGTLDLEALFHAHTLAYEVQLDVDSLQLTHFMPKDSLYLLTTQLKASGQGFDLASAKTRADLQASLKQLHYGRWKIDNVDLQAGLKESVASLNLQSANDLLEMSAHTNLRFDRTYLDGTLDMDVRQLELHELGLAPQPLKQPFAFRLTSEARHDSVKLRFDAGDMNLRFLARSTLKTMMERGNEFAALLMKQIDERKLNHADLRRLMPAAGFYVEAGKKNPLSYYLATQGIGFDNMKVNFGMNPQRGINGRASIHGFHMDSLQMDTIYLATRQDTTRLQLKAGVINAPGHPHVTFNTSLTGEIRNEDADLLWKFVDSEGETGVNFGINARPLTEGNGKGNGLLLRLIPEEPTIAFRNFRFVDEANWAYLHKNMRAYANINMQGDDGLGFSLLSNQSDTISLQNINLGLSRLRLDLLSDVLPYMPRLGGLFTVDAQFVQTESSLQLSGESTIDSLMYEGNLVGDIGLGAVWLPGEDEQHYLSGYLMADNREVLTADGMLLSGEKANMLDLNASLNRLPLTLANAFVPDQMVTLTGELNGEASVSGNMDAPKMAGELLLDSVSIYARQAGARYWFDNRPLRLSDNQLLFDKFAIYTTSENPFTIDGVVDLRDMSNPTANLTLLASNYTLLDAPRNRESLLYGKLLVDISARIRGPLDGLTMRGNMNLLGSTNVTYVMTDSPLTVEDRMDGLVTFTSFNDTTTVVEETPTMSLGGLEMNMSVHIDDAVRLRADLSSDRSKYVELVGGGDLNMQYSPQGDLALTGRYTLSGGSMKYSLPIIPLKEFAFSSGSYVDWKGNVMNPDLHLTATERMRASVGDSDGSTRMVNFDVSITIKNKLEAPELIFDIAAPEDATIQNELQAMGTEERSKQAIAMLATGIYLNSGVKGGGLDMGSALNSVLQSQINSLAGSALNSSNASFSMGVENRTLAETGGTQTDYSFRYSQRFFNDRVQIVIGGKVTTGANATNSTESFIDNISLEYKLDNSGTRYVRVFHNKNYESVLDGEITETGAGVVLRRKMDRLGELFIFKRK